MTAEEVRSLVIETVVSPGEAARKIVGFRLPTGVLWTALALIGVLNSLYYGLLLPGAAEAGLVPQTMAESPLLIAVIVLSILAAMAYLLRISGRMLGGAGDMADMLKITVWLQGLRLLAQVAISFISLISPAIGWLVAMVVGIWGLWILIVFIAAGHGFETLKGLGTLVMTFIATILIMSVLSAALGLGPPPGEL
ncbi:hypothetical protein OB2597_03549 [Pseudooceanicola batsensis HTCC2597]|uniref:Yip1 domain-containing protein n=1 Tax=Pseudooceanicola batsensis (strain ATCC BAA-863 / DSM 15984 / KCTC 12145 / HTCC2597) TaxID=252305 RepID=A3U434_PSEBH|nr:Yip1 family protein [Pseudooceanicola batsensis]EAQ01081.1 hypothetical protein OB2597_03549 [Pseudooceanicola batsensis HTCC2597]